MRSHTLRGTDPKLPRQTPDGLALADTTGMKNWKRALVLVAFLGLVGWGLISIVEDGNNAHTQSDWGIAKDNPLR